MASGTGRGNGRGMPLTVNTNHPGSQRRRDGSSGNRFSWAETPVELEEPQIRPQQYQPTESPIPQSPLDSPRRLPGQGQQQHHQPGSPGMQRGLPQASSPYDVQQPIQMHPAYFAPIVPESEATLPTSRPGSIPPPWQPPQPKSPPQSPLPQLPQTGTQGYSTQQPPMDERKRPIEPDPAPIKSQYVQVARQSNQPVFSPASFGGPNGPHPDAHQPGQVAHPNMDLASPGSKAQWLHSLCECSSDVGTCMNGIFCPCILDSRTAYRLAAKSEHRDSTDLLGFEKVNGRCLLMTFFGFCGLCCILPLTSRTRIRHSYRLSGNFVSDVLESCCCCCCVAIQNEREVREREGNRRAWAGPAQGVALVGDVEQVGTGMVYAPGGR